MREPSPTIERAYDQLRVRVYESSEALAQAAAIEAAAALARAQRAKGEATMIAATGNSQLPYLRTLRQATSFTWDRVRLIMIDQYLGLDEETLGTFAFLKQHLLDHVSLLDFHRIPSRPNDPAATCDQIETVLHTYPLDLASVGWGENGHLAFNDPHNTDFEDTNWVKVVELSQESRQQPVSEGRFPDLDHVPTRAITLTVPAILSARQILCIVPEARKSRAVRRLLEEPVAVSRPGSVLRHCRNAILYLDQESSSELKA